MWSNILAHAQAGVPKNLLAIISRKTTIARNNQRKCSICKRTILAEEPYITHTQFGVPVWRTITFNMCQYCIEQANEHIEELHELHEQQEEVK